MTDLSDTQTAYHEAAHAVAGQALGSPLVYLSVRPAEGEAGRTRFDTSSEGFSRLDDFGAAVVVVAGQVGERMYLGQDSGPNWFAEDDPDMENARVFVQHFFDDELDGRRIVALRARALLRTRWEAVQAVAAKLERDKVIVGDEVSKICLAEAARRRARSHDRLRRRHPKPSRSRCRSS